MKFGTGTHVDPLDRVFRQSFEILKSKMVAVAILQKNRKIASLTDCHHHILPIFTRAQQ